MKLRIVIDPDLCIGAASCVTIAPETFQMNMDNKAEIIGPAPSYERILEVNEEEKNTIIMGAQSCPTLAITIFDEDGKQLYPENV
jgi:ferredoxin